MNDKKGFVRKNGNGEPQSRERLRRRLRVKSLGFFFALCFTLVLLAAWNTGINLLYIVLSELASLIILSFFLSSWTLRKIRVSREAPEAVHRGTTFPVSIRIENWKRLMPLISVRVEQTERPEQTAAYFLKIPPKRAGLLRMNETMIHRGVYTLPPIEIITTFPFGLLEHRRYLKDNVEVIVYPRITTIRTGALEQLAGGHSVRRVIIGDGSEFFSMRDYIPGDDIRHIAWRVSARRGTLTVKEMSREAARDITFVCDTFAPDETLIPPEEFETAIELVASLTVALLARQYTVSIMTPTLTLKRDEGKGHITKALNLLARLNPITDPAVADFAWFSPGGDSSETTYVFVSTSPEKWGGRGPLPHSRIIDPREAVRA